MSHDNAGFVPGRARKGFLGSVCLAGLLVAYPVQAQQASEDPVAGEPGGSETQPGEEIVVTGSRIARTSITAPTPTVTVGAAQIEAQGITNAVDLLNQLPQISTGLSNANTSFTFGNAGLNMADLRNLGQRRTLTLVDGRRRAGTPDDANFLAFDLNNIPTALIERVEVQTGGTSAVYGADAVAGVINVILKKNFEGVEGFAQYGLADDGDYQTINYGFTAGARYDRGSAVLHVSRTENNTLYRGERGLGNLPRFVSNPLNTGPNDGIPGRIRMDNAYPAFSGIPTITARLPFGPGGAATPGNALNSVIFDSALQTFRPIATGPRGIIDGAYTESAEEGGNSDGDTLIPEVKRTNVYGHADFELTDNIKLFGDAIFSETRAEDSISPSFDSNTSVIKIDNPFMPTAVRDRLVAAGINSFTFSRADDELGRRGESIQRRYYSVSVGAEGTLANNWRWSAVYEYGAAAVTNRYLNERIDGRWNAGLDVIADPVTGDPICRDATWRAQGCLPINLFGVNSVSPAAAAWASADHTTTTDTSQTLAQALLSGDLFTLPAGEVKFSAGVEYRKDHIDFRPSYIWQNALGFFASQFSPINESTDSKEAFVEVLVPVVKDKPFFHSLELDGAFRVADYQRAGTATTWKLDATWAPIEDIRFRVSRAKAVRAPALGELFNPGNRGAASLTDPCDPLLLDAGTDKRRANCLALGLDPVTFDPQTRRVTTLVLTSGNPDLKVETANTLTAGVVLQPRFIPGLSFSVDYYRIKLDDGITRVGSQSTFNNCVDLASLDNQFCDLVTRDANGQIYEIRDSYINASGFKVEGFDFEADYSRRLNDIFPSDGDLGAVSLRAIASVLKNNVTTTVNFVTGESVSLQDAGEFDNPKFRLLLTGVYSIGPAQLTWTTRYVGKSVVDNNIANPAEDLGDAFHVPSIWYHSLSFGVDVSKQWRIHGGVNNVFDTGARDHPNTIRGTSAYDEQIGRFFFLGAKVRI
ncbi:TonB-dependent receptor plug domain-containing protein [Sphingopyxis fribergensis]